MSNELIKVTRAVTSYPCTHVIDSGQISYIDSQFLYCVEWSCRLCEEVAFTGYITEEAIRRLNPEVMRAITQMDPVLLLEKE